LAGSTKGARGAKILAVRSSIARKELKRNQKSSLKALV